MHKRPKKFVFQEVQARTATFRRRNSAALRGPSDAGELLRCDVFLTEDLNGFKSQFFILGGFKDLAQQRSHRNVAIQ